MTRVSIRTRIAVGAVVLFLVIAAGAQVVAAGGFLAFPLIALAGIVAIVNPPIGVAAVVVSIPLQEAVTVPFVRGELTFTQISLFGLALGWAITFYRYRVWLDSVLLGFVLVFAAFSISLVKMDDVGLWSGEVYRWIAAAAFFMICRSVLRSWQDIVPSIWAMIIGAIGVSLYSFWQLINGAGPDDFIVGGAMRVYATFGTPNTLAAYLEFTVPLLIVLSLFGFSSSFRARLGVPLWIASIAASGTGLLTLGLTQSRGGWIGMAVGLAVVFLVLPRRVKVSSIVVGVLLAGVFLITPAGQSQVGRFADVFESETPIVESEHQGALGRGSLWGAAVRMVQDHPLTGVGAGEFDYHYREYTPSWTDRFPRGQAHNGWLQMGAQAGIPGMIAFSTWLTASLLSLAGAIRRSGSQVSRFIAWGALAVMTAFAVHSLVDYLNVLSLSLQLSVMTAIGLNLAPEPYVGSPRGTAPEVSSATSGTIAEPAS